MRITTRQSNRLVGSATVAAVVTITTAVIAASSLNGRRQPDSFQPPARLSDTGLYVRALDGTLEVDPRNRPYSPQYPLWSDGAGKSRWVHLPEGAAIDVTNLDAWDFPVGTKFWKEFAFKGHKVETRFLWKASEEGWVFASYAWNDEQTDAMLVPEEGLPDVFEVARGTRHSIPSVSDCRACHDSARTEILGFNTLQLSDDRDPNAPHAEPLQPGMVTLRTLVEEGVLRPGREDLVKNPPRIAGDAVTRSAIGYLSANCGHCHNREGSLASVGLFLKHSSAAKRWQEETVAESAVGHASSWQIPGAPEGTSYRISPGAPDLSAVLHRMRSRRPSSQMPPLGTVIADQEGIETIERWVRELREKSKT
ncbi:MAG: hypothetical protein ACM36C_12860 [Acidobacteriota bacterium]